MKDKKVEGPSCRFNSNISCADKVPVATSAAGTPRSQRRGNSMEKSDWRDIPGYNGAYQISWFGEVRSWRKRGGGRLAAPHKMKTSWWHRNDRKNPGRKQIVKLTDEDGKWKKVPVVNLMVDVWLGGKREGFVAYHKNGDLSDNCANNIAFITREALGRKTGGASKRIPVVKINRSGEIVEVYPSARQAAKANYMSYQAVLDRCHGKVKNPFAADGHDYRFDD